MVAAARRGQAHELAQSEEGKDGEEHQCDNAAKDEGGAKNRDDTPPGADSGIEVRYRFACRGGLDPPRKHEADQAAEGEKRNNARRCCGKYRLCDHPIAGASSGDRPGAASAIRAARARVRNSALSSVVPRVTGAPNRAVQISGTIRKLPFGMTRFGLSR